MLSGDWNPLHVDSVSARRTVMGAPVVHGMHLVLWAIDRWLASKPGGRVRVLSLRAVFRKPVYLERDVVLDVKRDDDTIEIIATTVDGTGLELSLRVGAGTDGDAPIAHRTWPDPIPPDELTPENAARASGELELGIDAHHAGAAFPLVCERLGVPLVAELVATTRIVGMHCPGLHSLYSGLSLEASSSTSRHLAFEVADAKLKYSMITLRVNGPSLAGRLDTFYRPQPAGSLAMDDVVRAVTPSSFADQRALVVGGSRGLGEAFAKAIAAGGGEVCLTYHRGVADAERVVSEIRSAGLAAVAIALDVLSPSPLRDRWPFRAPPTHLYYLATPTLYAARKGAAFKSDELELMVRYFVTGLHATATNVVALGAEHLVVWTPSTTMLETSEGAAYCVAKAAMEELCRHLPTFLPVTVHAPRIGRVHTDQTIGLIQRTTASALETALEALQRLVGT